MTLGATGRINAASDGLLTDLYELTMGQAYLETFLFSEGDLDRLEQTGKFTWSTLDAFHAMRFAGDVHAMPEGTVCFPHEPILRVTAARPQAQLVETRVLNLLNFQTMVASNACRSVRWSPWTPTSMAGHCGSRGASG